MTDQFRQQGACSWFELSTSNVRGAEAFYSRLFGWSLEPWDGEGNYTLIKVEGKEIGGMKSPQSFENPSGATWGVYVTVTDVDETARKAAELGGKVLVPPKDIPRVGRYCVIQDPEGAVIKAISYTRG